MKSEFKQSLRLGHGFLLTPQLQQAIKLLQFSRIEIQEFIARELDENPALEEAPSINSDNESIGSGIVDYANIPNPPPTIREHLLSQVSEFELNELEKIVAIKIIENIDDDGYLDVDLDDFVRMEDVDRALAESVLKVVQRFRPLGVGARNLSECLLIQLREMRLTNGVVEKILSNHLKDIQERKYKQIAKSLGISESEVLKNIALIAGLNPNPGDCFGENIARFVIPDVYVINVDGEWEASLNNENLPRLQVSDYLKNISREKESVSSKDYVREHIKSATWLIKSLEQRQKTILAVSQTIVERQTEFLEKGKCFLKPMILKNISSKLGIDESTVSRVVHNKFMATPHGIFELKYFFSRSVSVNAGEAIASESVRTMMKDLILGEDVVHPYSDRELVELFAQKGIILARRTVAKYREALGLPSSAQRKRQKKIWEIEV